MGGLDAGEPGSHGVEGDVPRGRSQDAVDAQEGRGEPALGPRRLVRCHRRLLDARLPPQGSAGARLADPPHCARVLLYRMLAAISQTATELENPIVSRMRRARRAAGRGRAGAGNA